MDLRGENFVWMPMEFPLAFCFENRMLFCDKNMEKQGKKNEHNPGRNWHRQVVACEK